MAFAYANNTITQTGTDTDLSGLAGLTGVTTTTIGAIITYSLSSSIRLDITGDCLIDPRINELETTRVSSTAIDVTSTGTLTLGEEIFYGYGSQYTSGRALNIVGGSNVPWGGIFDITGTVNWYGCEVESASGINIYSGATLKIRDGVFISRLGNHTIQQGNAFIFQAGSTCDIIGLKKTLTGSLTHDNSAINILGAITTLNASSISSTGGISPDNRSTVLAPVPFSVTSNFKRLHYPIAQCRTSLNYFIDCATWDTPIALSLAYRSNFGGISRYGQAELYRNCNGKITVSGVGLEGAQLYWKDTNNGGRGTTTATEWLQEYITDREYFATTDVNGEFTQQVLEAAFYNTDPNVGVGTNPPVDDRTETGHKITFLGYKYGYGTFSIEFQGNTIVAAEATTPVTEDGNITEKDKLIVDMYLEIDTSAKLYDRAASFLEDNLGIYLDFVVLKFGNLIDAGSYDVVIDATAFDAFDLTGNVITIKATEFTGDMTTTGIITLLNGATFIGVRTDANGTIYPDLNVSITGVVANSRLQVFNMTTGLEVVNDFVFTTSYTATYPEGVGYSNGDVIRVRLTNADTLGYLGYETTVIAGTTGWSALANQELDTTYNNMGIGGSNVLKFSSDYVGNDIELSVASNFTVAEFYSYWVFNLTTAEGIRNFFNSVVAVNDANIMIDTDIMSLYFDSTVFQSVRQTDNRRLYRKDGLYPVRQPTTSGYGLDVTWQNEIFVVEIDVAVPSLTPAETANLAEITSVKTTTDQITFVGNDIKATLDGELVTTDTASRDASKANVSGLSTFDPTTDTVANVTLVATTTSLTNGSGGGLTVAQAAELTGIKAKTDVLSFTGSDVKATLDGEAVVTDTASRNASKADVSGLSTFDASTDTVANVTLVGTVTTNSDMRGTDDANTVVPDNTSIASILLDTNELQTNQGNFATADVSGLSTFDPATDTVANVTLVDTTTTNTDMRGTNGVTIPTNLSTFDPTNDVVANVTLVDTVTTNTDMRGTDGIVIPTNLSTFDPTTDTVANVTLVDTTTTNTDMRGTDGAITSVAGLSTFDASTDEVKTDSASRDASKADVSGLSTFDPATDTVANVTLSRY